MTEQKMNTHEELNKHRTLRRYERQCFYRWIGGQKPLSPPRSIGYYSTGMARHQADRAYFNFYFNPR